MSRPPHYGQGMKRDARRAGLARGDARGAGPFRVRHRRGHRGGARGTTGLHLPVLHVAVARAAARQPRARAHVLDVAADQGGRQRSASTSWPPGTRTSARASPGPVRRQVRGHRVGARPVRRPGTRRRERVGRLLAVGRVRRRRPHDRHRAGARPRRRPFAAAAALLPRTLRRHR